MQLSGTLQARLARPAWELRGRDSSEGRGDTCSVAAGGAAAVGSVHRLGLVAVAAAADAAAAAAAAAAVAVTAAVTDDDDNVDSLDAE